MSLSFNGIDTQVDWGDVAALDGLSKLTVSAWIVVKTAQGAFEYFINKADEVAFTGWALATGAVNTTALVLARDTLSVNNGSVVSAITLDTFMHWLYVYDGTATGDANRLKLYLNGTQQTLTFAGTIPAAMTANSASFMYAGITGDTRFAACTLAEIGIWPGIAITDTEVIARLAGTGGFSRHSPLFFEDLGLRFYDPGINFPDDQLRLCPASAIGGTLTIAAHPEGIIYPASAGLVGVGR